MATKEKKEIKLAKVLQDMSYSLNHIEDIMADDRALLVKLIKQNNSIVEWLKQIEIEDVSMDAEFEMLTKPNLTREEKKKFKKFEEVKDILSTFLKKQEELQEFEEELQKNKDKLTPGQMGES